MDMRDFLDRQLDRWIADALQTETFIAPAQKQRAWQRLYQQAAQQTALAPAAPRAPVWLSRLRNASQNAGRRLVWLLLDDSHYKRALHRRQSARSLLLLDASRHKTLWVSSFTHNPV